MGEVYIGGKRERLGGFLRVKCFYACVKKRERDSQTQREISCELRNRKTETQTD